MKDVLIEVWDSPRYQKIHENFMVLSSKSKELLAKIDYFIAHGSFKENKITKSNNRWTHT